MGANLLKRVGFHTDHKNIIFGNYIVLYKIGEEYVEIYWVVNRFQDITRIFDIEGKSTMKKGINWIDVAKCFGIFTIYLEQCGSIAGKSYRKLKNNV